MSPGPRNLVGALLILAVAAACGPVEAPSPAPSATPIATISTPSSPGSTPTHRPTIKPSVEPLPTPTTYLLRDLALPHHTTADVTAVCDAEQVGAIYCDEILRFAIPAVALVTDSPVERLYLELGACPAAPCASAEPSIATLYAWTTDGAWSMVLDGQNMTSSRPVGVSTPHWPASSGSAIPDLQPRTFPGAPDEVRDRDPVPFCGEAPNFDVVAGPCFRDAILEGRPAEMIYYLYPVDSGSTVLVLTRFDGSGAVVEYFRGGGEWSRALGSVAVKPDPGGVAFLQWGDREVIR